MKWTKLSCRTLKDNQTRLQLFALAYNVANFLRRMALPGEIDHWSLTTLRERLIKTGAKVTRHANYMTCQLAEVAVPRRLFTAILDRSTRLAMPPSGVATSCAKTQLARSKSRFQETLRAEVRIRNPNAGLESLLA